MLFLQYIPMNVLNGLYNLTLLLSFPALMIFAAWYAPQYALDRKRGAIYTIMLYAVLFGIMFLLPEILTWFGVSDTLNSSRCFLFVLIPAVLFSKCFGIPSMQGCDYVIPSLFVARAVGKIGCGILGCCHGFPCDWGVYSSIAGERVFPLQWLEVTFCVTMVVVCIKGAKRYQYQANGRVYGLAMVVFGVERYLIQFLTTDYQFAIGFNMQSIYAILMFLLGLLTLYFVDNPIKTHRTKE